MKFYAFIVLLLVGLDVFGQTFTASPGTAIPSLATITSTISVTGVGEINCDYGLEEVCINITHTYDADLDIFLIDPNGDAYMLTTDNGGSGNNYSVTCFNMTAATSVTLGTAPFNGTYRPEGDISLANNFQDADGVWTLQVTDDASGDVGTLVSWSLVFAANPECIEPTTADCFGGTTVCSDETFTGNSIGSGGFSELTPANDGCLSGEHQSSWYFFQAASDGTYAFTIETLVDYDFAVWGPLTAVECPPVGAPLRCSYSGTLGNTGLQAGAGDTSEGAGGDAVVDPITALEDDIFIILIDNFTADGTSFDLTWTLTGGATFDCTLLPIELIDFKGYASSNANIIEWITASELNNSHYTLDRSVDGINWIRVGEVAGAGNSSSELNYTFRDDVKDDQIYYYRLFQYDFDGKSENLGVISVNRGEGKTVERILNVMGVEVTDDYDGLKIYIYTDGSVSKVISR